MTKSLTFITHVNGFFPAQLLYVIKNNIFVVRTLSSVALIY